MIPSSTPTGRFWTTARPPPEAVMGWSAARAGPCSAKYAKISAQNATSSRASASGLPISSVMTAASSSTRSVNSVPTRAATAARSSIGRVRQARNAASAPARASCTWASVAVGCSARTRPVAGLTDR
ncbi:hypothetical protein H488_0103960 [Kocuria sp. UCD-OTCP]|nr:hypothetical protein H488_0103960 [Kocuria sp. UCD-OTCP]